MTKSDEYSAEKTTTGAPTKLRESAEKSQQEDPRRQRPEIASSGKVRVPSGLRCLPAFDQLRGSILAEAIVSQKGRPNPVLTAREVIQPAHKSVCDQAG